MSLNILIKFLVALLASKLGLQDHKLFTIVSVDVNADQSNPYSDETNVAVSVGDLLLHLQNLHLLCLAN